MSSVSGEVNENNELVITVNGVSGAGIPLPESEVYIFGQKKEYYFAIMLNTGGLSKEQDVSYHIRSGGMSSIINNIFAGGTDSSAIRGVGYLNDSYGTSSESTKYYVDTYANMWYKLANSSIYEVHSISKTSSTPIYTGYILIHNVYCGGYVWADYDYKMDVILDIVNKKIKFSKPIMAQSHKIAGYQSEVDFYISQSSYCEYFETEPAFN